MHNDIKNPSNVGIGRDLSLRLGQVDFINCLPINLPIELGEVKINARIINDVPSKLNELILRSEIHIAPVSSFAYLENKDKLVPIGNLCIASDGPADSVLLFSKFPIEELDGVKILLSSASATSNKLLQIIFKRFLKINATFESNRSETRDWRSEYSAKLFIGDHALREFSETRRDVFIYDLGSLWKKHTELPMIFGIWVARKEVFESHQNEINILAEQLNTAKEIGLGKGFDKVVKKAQEKVLISKEFYSTYFQHLSYEFTDECRKGLSLFEKYCKKSQKEPNKVKVLS